jgi:DNA-binding transcriptional ArsR family regulator
MSRDSPESGRAASSSAGYEDELWAAIAEPSRRQLLDVLLAHGEATPTILAAQLPFTRQAVSKHLAVLARVGLVEAHRSGRETRYTVRLERLDAAAQAMAQAAARWDRRLQTIKRLAEAAHHEHQRTEPNHRP